MSPANNALEVNIRLTLTFAPTSLLGCNAHLRLLCIPQIGKPGDHSCIVIGGNGANRSAASAASRCSTRLRPRLTTFRCWDRHDWRSKDRGSAGKPTSHRRSTASKNNASTRLRGIGPSWTERAVQPGFGLRLALNCCIVHWRYTRLKPRPASAGLAKRGLGLRKCATEHAIQ